MKRIPFMVFAVLATALSALGTEEVRLGDAYVKWSASELAVGNAHFKRIYRSVGGVPRTVSFGTEDGVELLSGGGAGEAESLDVVAKCGRPSPVSEECIRVEVRGRLGSMALQVFPSAAGPVVTRPRTIDFAALGEEPKDYREAHRWRKEKMRKILADADPLWFAARHLKLTSFELFDQTDETDELVVEREWLLAANERETFLSCNVLDVRDAVTGRGVVFLRFAPMPSSRPEPDLDFAFGGGSRRIAALANGYPVAELAYCGGDVGRTRALHRAQRCFRSYRPGRDGVFLSNTWGDGNRDARINEKFLLDEVAAGAELGVDVIQIDDGWQKGRSSNSAAVKKGGGTWGRYWDVDPEFWKPCPERFPNGLRPVVERARAKGLRFGLWFGPDSSNDFAHWEDDAACLLDYYRSLGIEYFKIDSVTIRSGVALDRQRRMFDRMLADSDGAMTFDLDCTASTRPGYFGLVDIGPLFVENRYCRKGDVRLWYPHRTLRNLWRLARTVDPVRLRMEVLNPLRLPELYGDDPLAPSKWPLDAPFAIAMCASPLGWFEISNLDPKTVAAMKPLVSRWKGERDNIHGGFTFPVGAEPDGFSWTGFLTEAADGRSAYALLFRELSAESAFALPVAGSGRYGSCEVLGGVGTARFDGARLEVSVPERLGFIWVRMR